MVINCLKETLLSPLVDSLLDISIKKIRNHNNTYGLFIDKKSEGMSDYEITIAPFKSKVSSLYESGALNYLIYDDSILVFIYTGLEYFLKSDSLRFMQIKKLPAEATGEFKNIDYYRNIVDFTNGLSYVHFDTTTYMLSGETVPFSNLRTLPPCTIFVPDK